MANAKQCDICSNFYAAHKLSKRCRGFGVRDTAAVILHDPDPDATSLDEMEYPEDGLETCPECMKRIKEFINAMKENKNEST